MAGLGAARTLQQAGQTVTIYEKSKGYGGRVATRRVGPYTFDTGASSIAPRGRSLEAVMLHELDRTELVEIGVPIYTHNGIRVGPGDITRNRAPRYAYRSGNTKLAKLLATGIDIRFEQVIARFRKNGDSFELAGETYDALILTPPAPQTQSLLDASDIRRSISQASFRSCLAVLLGYDQPNPSMAYHAIIEPDQRYPLTWLCFESVKCPDRAPEGHCAMVAQLSPSYSLSHYEEADAQIIADTVEYVVRLYGSKYAKPLVADVKRWRFSQPESFALFDSVNEPGSRLVIAGDGTLGARVEFAFETGARAARQLLEIS